MTSTYDGRNSGPDIQSRLLVAEARIAVFDQGPGSVTTFNQVQASQVWVIDHGLSHLPNVITYDSALTEIIGDVRVVSPSRIEIHFTAATGGTATLT